MESYCLIKMLINSVTKTALMYIEHVQKRYGLCKIAFTTKRLLQLHVQQQQHGVVQEYIPLLFSLLRSSLPPR